MDRQNAMRIAFLCAVACVIFLTAIGNAQAQMTLVVPYAPGGPSDTLARTLATSLAGALGTSVPILNVVGSRGADAAVAVANGPNDGTNLLYADLALAQVLRADGRGVSLLESFVPIGIVGERPLVLITKHGGSITSLNDLKNGARFGTSGPGSSSDTCALGLQRHLGAAVELVRTYRGAIPLHQALANNSVDLICLDLDAVSLRERVLALSMRSSHPSLKDVPTLKELGIDFEYRGLVGLFVAKGVPQAQLSKLEAALKAAIRDPPTRSRYQSAFYEIDN